MEIIDVARRMPRYWGHCDLATGRPPRRGIRKGCKESGDALQDSAATCRESVRRNVRRCGRRRSAVVVSTNWGGVHSRELLSPPRLRTPAFGDGAEAPWRTPPSNVACSQVT